MGYEWPLIDTVPVKDTMRIKIQQEGKDVVESHNTADFKILGVITLTGDSNGGGAWYLGDDAYVTWTTYGAIGNVDIAFSQNGTNFTEIKTGYACNSSGSWSYTWSALPTTTITGDVVKTARLRIQPQSGSTPADISDSALTVKQKSMMWRPQAA